MAGFPVQNFFFEHVRLFGFFVTMLITGVNRYASYGSSLLVSLPPRPGHMDPREASGSGFNPSKLGAGGGYLCQHW